MKPASLLAANQPSLAKRATARQAKNIENNPMQRKETLENKGAAGMDI